MPLPKKVILDTNLIIAFLLSSRETSIKQILKEFKNKTKIQLYTSTHHLLEIKETLRSKKLQSRIDTQKAARLIADLTFQSILVEPTTLPNVCRDEEDNFLLALASASNADYLVTLDKDLLVLKTYESTKIIRPEYLIELI
jgi:putative PIN family toxin of toxin-antitoxin system